MAEFLIFCYFMLVPWCYASVIRNGMKLVALPTPGTVYKNDSIIVNTRSERNDIGGNQAQEVHTVIVKTPATLTFSNVSQHHKSIVQQLSSSLGDGITAMSHLDPSELIDLDLPVRANDFLKLAKSSSPTLQQKSVNQYPLKNELEAGNHKIVKRESTWDASDMPDTVWTPVLYTHKVRWPTFEIPNSPRWPVVLIFNPIPETSAFGRSIDVRAAHLPIHNLHHPHLLHRARLPNHRPAPRLPNWHLLPLLRSEALPILRFPLALLNFYLARPMQPPFSTTQSMMNPLPRPMDAEFERPHRGRPQAQEYHSLAYYHGQESNAQLPERLPVVNPPWSLESYQGSPEQQADAEVDRILASVHKNTETTNYKPVSPWEGIFFSLFRDFSLT